MMMHWGKYALGASRLCYYLIMPQNDRSLVVGERGTHAKFIAARSYCM